jgi:hypothetical protein
METSELLKVTEAIDYLKNAVDKATNPGVRHIYNLAFQIIMKRFRENAGSSADFDLLFFTEVFLSYLRNLKLLSNSPGRIVRVRRHDSDLVGGPACDIASERDE